jgi:CheY-like chemotaxis protein
VLLTDVVMTGMSGPELARQARASRPQMPVVFMTGYADPGGVAGGEPLHRLVRKPFRPADLRDQIEAALAASRTVAR